MATIPSRSNDLTAAGERKRKERGSTVTKGTSIPATMPNPDDAWCSTARLVWDSMTESGGAAYYESSDYAVLYMACDQIDHLYQQGARRSPEYLRVIMQTLGTLLATEGDRRKLRIELERTDGSDSNVIASVDRLFESA